MSNSKVQLTAFILTIFLFYVATKTHAQGNLFTHNFLPNNYPGKTQNWAIKVDSNNVVWIGNQDGVMSFNGTNWQMIQTPQKSTIRSLEFNNSGKLYAGGISDFGFISDSLNSQTFISLKPKLPEGIAFNDVWSIKSNNDQVVFLTDNYLFHLINDSIYLTPKTQDYFYLAYKTGHNILAQQMGGGLYLIKKQRIEKIENSNFFSKIKIHAIIEIEKNHLICTKNNGIFKVKFDSAYSKMLKIEPFQTTIDDELKKYSIYQAKKISHNRIAYATTTNGLYITDLEGKTTQHLSTRNQLLTDAVYDFTKTKDETLWLAQDMGLSIIETGIPITYFDYRSGIKGSTSEIIHFEEFLYVTTGFGLYFMKLNAPFKDRNFTKVENITSQAWSIIEIPGKLTSHLYITSSEGIFKIIGNTVSKVFDYSDIYLLYPYPERSEYIFAGTQYGLLLLHKGSHKWTKIHEFSNIHQQVRDIASDNHENIWFAVNYKGFFKISHKEINNLIDQQIAPVIKIKDTIQGIKNLRDIQFHETKTELIFLASPDLYTYEETTDNFRLMPDTVSQTNNTDSTPVLTIENNILKFDFKSTHINDSATLKRIPYNITNAAISDSSTIWIGTENGLYQYIINRETNTKKPFRIITEKIKFGQTLWQKIYNQTQPIDTIINYKSNSISATIGIPFYYNHTENKVSFYLEGFDRTFEPWHQQFQKSYTNLPPGNYILHARAKNTFGEIIQKTILRISITPPFYRTPLAYFTYFIIWIIGMILAIRYRTTKLRKSRDKLDSIVKERTQQLLDRNEEVMQVAEILKQNNQKLKELSIVAEKAGNAVAIFDKNGKLDYCNNAFEQLYGYSCAEFIKERGDTLFMNSEYPHIKKAYKDCLKSKSSVQYEYFTISKTHTGLWIHTTLTPVFDGEDTPHRFIAIDTNITQLKNAEEEVRFQKEELERKSKEVAEKNQELLRLSIIARETDNAVLLTDKKGQILWLNEGFTRLYGYSIEDLKSGGKNVFSMSSNRKISEYISNWPTKQSSITYESRNLTSKGIEIWAQTTLTPIKNEAGEITQIIAIDSDITALKLAEEQIEKQRDQLKVVNATKDKFFSIIGHDLRSPFGNFINMSNIIMQNITTADTNTLINYVSKLHRSAQNSYNLLENLLDWARHQQGKIKIYPDYIDITSVVEEMTELLLPLAEGKKIQVDLTYDEPIYAYFDEQMVKTVVRNILFNALKYTPSGGNIQIYFKITENTVCLFVKDSGIGISNNAQAKLFKADTHFSTLGTDKERGTGLGLMLSKDFIEMNNGKISVESTQGEGSTFKICLAKHADM